MRTRQANTYARMRYIDRLLDQHDINEVIIMVREATGCTIRGAVQMVMARVRQR